MLIRVVDVETTGLPPDAAVCEIGWCDVTDDGGWAPGRPYNLLCNPGRAMPAQARAIHHLSDADLSLYQPASVVIAAFLQIDPVPNLYCAHNAPFEQAFIKTDKTWIDTLRAARHAYPDNEAGFGNQVLRYWMGLELDPYLASPPHRAGPDAYVTACILSNMLSSGITAEQLALWSVSPLVLKRVEFGKHKGMLWAEVPPDYLDWIVRQADMNPDVLYTARHYLDARRKR